MTNQTQTDRLADEYYVRKNGYYYRPNAQGYTVVEAEAGRFTLDEAIAYSYPNGPDGPRDGIRYEPVPTQTDRLAEVLDCDREAAADAVKAYRDRKNNDWQQRIRDCKCDDGTMVQAFARHRIAATQSLSTGLANAEARVKELEGERGLLLAVMDAADRYNGVHSQSAQPMARMQGTLMLAISRAYRELGLSRDELARATLNPGKEP